MHCLQSKIFEDKRGFLIKPYCNEWLEAKDRHDISEIWFTKSKKDVIRGLHMQLGNSPARKIVSVIKGSVLDVTIDLRRNSPTFLCVYKKVLSDTNGLALAIPEGVAHGYRVLEEGTITMYGSNKVHSADDDIGVLYSSIDFDWGLSRPIISDRDKSLPTLEEYLKIK